jgi:hypothetical protein
MNNGDWKEKSAVAGVRDPRERSAAAFQAKTEATEVEHLSMSIAFSVLASAFQERRSPASSSSAQRENEVATNERAQAYPLVSWAVASPVGPCKDAVAVVTAVRLMMTETPLYSYETVVGVTVLAETGVNTPLYSKLVTLLLTIVTEVASDVCPPQFPLHVPFHENLRRCAARLCSDASPKESARKSEIGIAAITARRSINIKSPQKAIGPGGPTAYRHRRSHNRR